MAKYSLVWLASYPKSGNTWVRSFFTALLKKESFDINNLDYSEFYADKNLFQKLVKKDVSTFGESELESERRKVLDFYIRTKPTPYLMKIHDRFSYSVHDSLPVFQTNFPTAAIYIFRNPLDITLSFSRYLGISIDEIIERYICKPGSTIFMNNRFPRTIGTWDEHFNSWHEQKSIPTHFVRYEDLKLNTHQTFKEMLTFMGMEYSDEEITDAIRQTDFNLLKNMEEEKGFRESLIPKVPFFHTGKINQGELTLTPAQIEKINAINKKAIEMYGNS